MRSQQEWESVSAFVVGLQRLSEPCKFEEMLDDMLWDRLRDWLVCGVRDERLQQRLLAEPDLTFKKAMVLCQAIEAVELNAKDLQARQPPKTATVLALNKPTKSRRPPAASVTTKCSRCGGQHPAKDCSFKDAECHYCKKRGHIAKVCHTKAKDKQRRKTHQLMRDDEETEESGTYPLYRTCSKVTDPYHSHSGGKQS